jgi:hypothetical protein
MRAVPALSSVSHRHQKLPRAAAALIAFVHSPYRRALRSASALTWGCRSGSDDCFGALACLFCAVQLCVLPQKSIKSIHLSLLPLPMCLHQRAHAFDANTNERDGSHSAGCGTGHKPPNPAPKMHALGVMPAARMASLLRMNATPGSTPQAAVPMQADANTSSL